MNVPPRCQRPKRDNLHPLRCHPGGAELSLVPLLHKGAVGQGPGCCQKKKGERHPQGPDPAPQGGHALLPDQCIHWRRGSDCDGGSIPALLSGEGAMGRIGTKPAVAGHCPALTYQVFPGSRLRLATFCSRSRALLLILSLCGKGGLLEGWQCSVSAPV